MELKFNLLIFDDVLLEDDYYFIKASLKKSSLVLEHFNTISGKPLGKKPNFTEPFHQIQVIGQYKEKNDFFTLQGPQIYQEFLMEWTKNLRTVKRNLGFGHVELENIKSVCLPWLTIQSAKAYQYHLASSHERVPVSSMKFGSLINSSHFIYHTELQTIKSDVAEYMECLEASFFHDTKQGELIFDNEHALRFNYSGIRQILVELKPKGSGMTLYLHLINPPSAVECEEMAFSNRALFKTKPSFFYTRTVLTVPGVSEDVLGRSNIIALDIPKLYDANAILSRLFFRMGKIPVVYVVMDSYKEPAPVGFPDLDIGHFGCTYMLTGLVRRRFTMQLQNPNMQIVSEKLSEYAKENPTCLYKVLEDVLQLMDEGVLLNYFSTILKLYEDSKQSIVDEEAKLAPVNTKKVWRIVITPTRLLLYPAEVIFGNRVIRQFSCEHALRVSFRDDSFGRISRASLRCSQEYVNAMIFFPMEGGLRIGQRFYEFLGWSNSQLRDHGCYMYAKDASGNDAVSIRQWMGDFQNITNVPKFMARMGQCFSHTEPTVSVPLTSSRVKTELDVEGGINPASGKAYCFSDGVGRISHKLMKEVAEVMLFKDVPSAVQFRYAGYKGMLTLDPTLEDYDIIFRESQRKFPCEGCDKLEIVSKSTATALQLNKQLITILDQKGVPVEVFLQIQQDMLRYLTAMLFENEKAAEYLSTHSAMPGIDFKSLANVGIGLNSEPFFRNILLAQHRVAVEGIKEKARLDIDHSLGRNMFGIMDETGKLEYGQVFVQYTTRIEECDLSQKSTSIHIGKVMVTKNPCLQLGDVRIFEAVNVIELSHIVDCIVFPSKGPRPHPSEMAGSDLDGDEYAVIWKKELFFKGKNSEASIFPIPNQETHKGEIKIHDMLQFLSKYIMNDNLGVIANAHLARADDPDHGLEHPICKSIARKFSIAVDFAKNGQEVKLSNDERPQKYPDFMEKGSHANTYKSKRTLGKLYRICKEYEEGNKISAETVPNIQPDPNLIVPGWKKYEASAILACEKYKRSLGNVLTHYGIQSDHEACGKALTKIHSRLDRQERLDIEEILTRTIHHLWTINEEDFNEEFKITGLSLESEEALCKASAWYHAAYSSAKKSYLSFAWICWKQLIILKKKHSPIILPNPYIEQLNCTLMEWIHHNPFIPLDKQSKALCKKAAKKNKNIGDLKLELSLQILLHWANFHNVLEPDLAVRNKSAKDILYSNSKKVPTNFFSRMFDHSIQNYRQSPKIMDLLLNFFNLCITWRFPTSDDQVVDPNLVKKLKYLGKQTMATYHNLAVGMDFRCLGLSTKEGSIHVMETGEMDPIRVKVENVKNYAAFEYDALKKTLKRESGATEVNVRQIKQYLLVSASGTKLSHRMLKKFLYKISCDTKSSDNKVKAPDGKREKNIKVLTCKS